MAGLNTADVVVVGGGISGLAVTHRLAREGFSVTLLDSAPQLGGMVKTLRQDGYILECGPNSCLSSPALLDLIDELEIQEQLSFPKANCQTRFIVRAGNESAALTTFPRSVQEAIKSPILSVSAKLRLLLEPLIPRTKKEDESVEAFMTRRLGCEVTSRIVATMLSGIWAADIRKLSCRTALPKIWNLEQKHGSLSRGFAQSQFKKSRGKKTKGGILSFRGGMQNLVEGLSRQLPAGTVSRNAEVQSIEKSGSTLLVRYKKRIPGTESAATKSIRCKQVVITTPAAVTARLVQQFDAKLAREIAAVPYAPLGVLHLAYKREDLIHPLDGFGFLAEPQGGQVLVGAIFNSSLFSERAPSDEHLLTCFAGGSNNPGASDVRKAEIRNAAIRELNQLVGAKNHPRILHCQHYPAAIPNFPLGHHRLQAEVASFSNRNPEFTIIGNWLKGISIGDRIEAGLSAADQLLDILETKRVQNWS